MHFHTPTALALALGLGLFAHTASAVPSPPALRSIGSDVTVGQAGDVCGENLELSCCNQVDQTGDTATSASGVLSGALQGLLANGQVGVFDGCSKLSLSAIVGLNTILNSQCKQAVACCQDSGVKQSGLINAGLPCVALGGVL